MRYLLSVALAVLVALPAFSQRKRQARPRRAVPVKKAQGPVETAHRRVPYVGAISADAATGTGIAQAFIDYHDPALPDEDYYLMLGKASLHLTANEGGLDDRAILLAEAILSLP